MLPAKVTVVCLAVGTATEEYIVRLESMLRRHMPVPFDLRCVVDRPRELPASITQIDASGWPPPREGMRMTTYKLSLFDRERMPFDEFLYLDTSLVVHRDMTELIEFAFGRPEELVVQKDWNYDAYNTCVMRIRPGGVLEGIVRAYEEGAPHDVRNRGDQDFVTGVVRERGWGAQVATFPEGLVAGYRVARRLARRHPREAKAMLERATLVKFYSKPKMHQLLSPRWRLGQVWETKKPWHRNAWFWVGELRERWR